MIETRKGAITPPPDDFVIEFCTLGLARHCGGEGENAAMQRP
jgi:hypothetical protein